MNWLAGLNEPDQLPNQSLGRSDTLPLGLLEFLSFRPEIPLAQQRDGGVQAAVIADRAGYRRLWVPEHHARGVPSTNPLVLLPVLGSLTRTIRIGTAVSLIRIRDPYLLAEDLATAAHFCRDRLDIGLGRGDVRGPGTEVLDGVRKDEAALDEAVAVISALIERGNAWIDPVGGAYQQWMHGAGFRSAEVAATMGLDYCHALFFNPDLSAALRTLETHAAAHPSGRRAVAIGVVANPDPQRAEADSRLGGIKITVVGSAEECSEQILDLLDRPVIDEVVITEQSARIEDHHRALDQIADLVGEALGRAGRGVTFGTSPALAAASAG